MELRFTQNMGAFFTRSVRKTFSSKTLRYIASRFIKMLQLI